MSTTIGTFVISLDTEIAWGRIELADRFSYYPFFGKTKDVMRRLLELFDKYDIPATWAVVGRLVEEPGNHAEPLETFYANTTEKSLYEDPIRHANINDSWLLFPELIQLIQNSKAAHEIGSHTYSHILFGDWQKDKGCTQEQAIKDYKATKKIWDGFGIQPKTFIFPRNAVKHEQFLPKFGFTTYRAADLPAYENFKGKIGSLLRSLDMFLPTAPRTSKPWHDKNGLVVQHGSLHFKVLHYMYRRFVPMRILQAKAIAGLNKAAQNGEIFHLWFHPFDFGHRTEEHFAAFEEVLKHAKKLRDSNKLDICTMDSIAAKYNKNLQNNIQQYV